MTNAVDVQDHLSHTECSIAFHMYVLRPSLLPDDRYSKKRHHMVLLSQRGRINALPLKI